MDAPEYARMLLRHWVPILIVSVLAVIAAAGYCLAAPIKFQSSAKVFVSLQQAGSVQELSQGSAFTQQQVKSYADLASTPAVLNPVIRQLKLNESSDSLASSVSAVAPLDTVIISITATASNARQARDLVDAISNSLTSAVQNLTPSSQGAGNSVVKLTVVQPGDMPRTPTSPNVLLIMGGALMGGVLFGVAGVIAWRRFDTRFHSEKDIEAVANAPLLSRIYFNGEYRNRPVMLVNSPTSPAAESYRLLKANLQFLNFDAARKFWVITSSLPSEGKSTTAVNLAVAIADSGMSVVLVDADLRRPAVASYLGVDGSLGLSDVVTGRAHLSQALQQWGESMLHILPSGAVPPNPSELLQSKSAESLFQQLASDFDVVVIDAPPILPVVDALVLGNQAGGVLLVCAPSKTRTGHLAASVKAVHQAGAKVDGVVLTMLRPSRSFAGQYGSDYGYYGVDRPLTKA